MAYNPQQIMSDIQGQNLNNMRNLIIRANNDPRSLSQEQLQTALQFGQQLGIDMSPAMKKDKATFVEHLGAGTIGAVDSALFGIIPDKWYSSYRTKTSKNIGKAAGSLASFGPFGVFNAAKGAKGITSAAKAIIKAGTNSAGAIKGVKTAGEAVALAKTLGPQLYKEGFDALKLALKGMSNAQIAKEMAKLLLRTGQVMSNVPNAINPDNDTSQLNPYTQEMGIGGMPQMP